MLPIESKQRYVIKFDANLSGGATDTPRSLATEERPADLSRPVNPSLDDYNHFGFGNFYKKFYQYMDTFGFEHTQESTVISSDAITYTELLDKLNTVSKYMSYVSALNVDHNPFRSVKIFPVQDVMELGGVREDGAKNPIEQMCNGEHVELAFNSDEPRRWSIMYDFVRAGRDGNMSHSAFTTVASRYGFKQVSQNSSLMYTEEEMTPKQFMEVLHLMCEENPRIAEICHSNPPPARSRQSSFIISDYATTEREFSNEFRDMFINNEIHRPENLPRYKIAEDLMINMDYGTGKFVTCYQAENGDCFNVSLGSSPSNVYANINQLATDIDCNAQLSGFELRPISEKQYHDHVDNAHKTVDYALDNAALSKEINLDFSPDRVYQLSRYYYNDYKLRTKAADTYGLTSLSVERSVVSRDTLLQDKSMQQWRMNPSYVPPCMVSSGRKGVDGIPMGDPEELVGNVLLVPTGRGGAEVTDMVEQKAQWDSFLGAEERIDSLFNECSQKYDVATQKFADYALEHYPNVFNTSNPITLKYYKDGLRDSFVVRSVAHVLNQNFGRFRDASPEFVALNQEYIRSRKTYEYASELRKQLVSNAEPMLHRVSLSASNKFSESDVVDLAKKYADEVFVKNGRYAQVSVARPKEDEDYRIVLMVSDRQVNQDGKLQRRDSDKKVVTHSRGSYTNGVKKQSYTTFQDVLYSIDGSNKDFFREYLAMEWCNMHNQFAKEKNLRTDDGQLLQVIPQNNRATFNTFVAEHIQEDAKYRDKSVEVVLKDFRNEKIRERKALVR